MSLSVAQNSFFSPSSPALHTLVLFFLSDPDSPHPVLPLLQVSRYWRSFTRDFLLQPYKKTKEKGGSRSTIQKGEYVKFYFTPFCPHEVHKADDPRSYFTKNGSTDLEVYLLFDSIDPLTHLCTFLPASTGKDFFNITLLCDAETRSPYPDICPSFGLVPSTWFVPADKKAKRRSALFGKEVAFNRDAYPDAHPFTWSPQPEEPGGVGEEKHGEKRGWAKGWSVEYTVTRLDTKKTKLSREDKSFEMFSAPMKVKFGSARIPLFQLYHPYRLDEEGGYSSGEDEFYWEDGFDWEDGFF